jgi:Tol biopolymer transport system component
MTDVRPLDRMVTDWLRAEAPMRAPEGSLDAVMRRVAETNQRPHLTQRLFGLDRGRSHSLRLALLVALLTTFLIATVLAAGLLRPPDMTSGTDGWVVFTRQGGPIGTHAETEVWLLRPGASPEPAIPAALGIDRDCAALSPDGREVSFIETDLNSRATSLVVARLLASGGLDERLRLSLDAKPGCPAWSPVAPFLTFGSAGGDLALADLTERSIQLLWAPPGDALVGDVAWAPDGIRVAVTTGRQIHVVGLDGAAPALVAESRGEHGPNTGIEEFDGLSWSPDGDVLAVWGENNYDDPGGSFMRVIRLDGSGEGNLPVNGSVAAPMWSPVDSSLAFVENRADIVVYRNSGLPGEAAQNSRLPRFDPAADGSRAGITTFVWSQDGQRIVYGLFRLVDDQDGNPVEDETALAVVTVHGDAHPVLILPFGPDLFSPSGAQAAPP